MNLKNISNYLEWWRAYHNYDKSCFPSDDQVFEDFWRLMRIARKMHLWIFKHTFDDTEAYRECGLTDSDDEMLGYGGQIIVRVDREVKDGNSNMV